MPPQITRRDFLKVSFTAGGALLVGSYLNACTPSEETASPTPAPTSTTTPIPQEPFQPNLFVRIDPDGMVTLTIHRSEMGQGVRTALAMILADELEAEWASVRIEQSPANSRIGSQTTGGSGSIADHFLSLRTAAATAREMLLAAAAQFWAVPAEECKAVQGEVIHEGTGRRVGYGKLIGAAKDVKLTGLPRLKDPKDFRLIGTSLPRIDDPAIVTGKVVYGLDVRLPGMLYATLARCPVPDGKLVEYDSTLAESVAGVRAVVAVTRGVAVVAESTWAAIQGRLALKVTWDEGPNAAYSTASIRQQLADKVNETIANESRSSLTTIEAVYETPYLAHASMEPMNCVADYHPDRCDIWAATQNPQDIQTFVRRAVNVPVNVNVTLLGGGFGRRLEVDYAVEAAEVSKAVGAPIQVVWTREDDIQHDYYRQPTYHWMRAGWGNDGTLELWRHYIAGPGLNGMAYRVGQEVLEEGLFAPYDAADRISRSALVNIPLPTGPWRAVMSGPNAFANEGFFDELAAALGRDPYEFRLELLRDTDPLRSVLELVAAKANWGTPPPEGQGRGIACHTYHSTAVAMVADVSVQDGTVQVHQVVCAINCGRAIHPDMIAQQMEGSIAFGLTSLLNGEITFEGGRVQQGNFNDYPLLQMSGMPDVDVHIVPDDRAPTGTGEMGVPPIVPAVTNAIFNATGIRIRHTPIRPEDLQTK